MYDEEPRSVKYSAFGHHHSSTSILRSQSASSGEFSHKSRSFVTTMGNCVGVHSPGSKSPPLPCSPTTETYQSSQPAEFDMELKVVLVGDSMCGKSALAMRFVSNTFNEIYTPTNFDKQNLTVHIGQIRVHFNIWDTSGSSAHDSVRPLAFSDAKVFLVCFDIGDPASLDHVVTKWFQEIRSHCDKVPMILCGCRSDLRSNVEVISILAQRKQIPVTSEQALQVSRIIGASTYVETSAVSPGSQCIREAFEVAALAAAGKLNSNGMEKRSPFKSSAKPIKSKLEKVKKGHDNHKCCIA